LIHLWKKIPKLLWC